MIEFNTADGEKLTLMHDRVAVKGAPGSDRCCLFVGDGGFHPLLHSYEEVVATMEHFVYGPDQVSEPPAPTEEAIAKVVADDREERELAANDGPGPLPATDLEVAQAAEHAKGAQGAGTEHQPA